MRLVLPLLCLAACSDFDLTKRKDPPEEGVRELEVDPGVIEFGTLASSAPVSETVLVTSVGSLPVTVSDVDVAGSGAYGITWVQAETVLQPGESMPVVVTYIPVSLSDHATLVVTSDAVNPTNVVQLDGGGIYPAIQVDPGSVSFVSEYGGPVTETVHVTSIGTADLELSSMLVQGEWFAAEGDIPTVLAPGEGMDLVVTYTPEVPGETVSGKLWIMDNTPIGYAVVPLEAHQGPTCIGLGEAWDRALLDPHTGIEGSLQITNQSADEEICIDDWYVYLAEESQDMGAGDMDGDVGGDYPSGSLSIAPGDTLRFPAAALTDASWWCMELTQYTQPNKDYEFLGARVPEPLRSYMYDGDQSSVWSYEDSNPVIIAARRTNYVEVPAGGGSDSITIRALNMGSRAGNAELWETIPAGYTASGFSSSPARQVTNSDGSTTFVFPVSLAAREITGEYEDTIYDQQTFTYTLTTPPCAGRQYLPVMATFWTDSEGTSRSDTANPLVVNCQP